MIKRSIFYFIFFVVLWTGFIVFIHDKYTVPILMYHRVGSFTARGDLNIVSQKSFAHQMKFLHKHGYHVISLDDLVEGINKGFSFNRKTVVITFDDGYEDNYDQAFPILRRYDIPATIFLVSDWVGSPDFMTWEQLREMQGSNIEFGSHSRKHAYLPDVKHHAQLEDEIINSKKVLEENLGEPVRYFSYPSGGYTEEVKEIVIKAKYKGACATNRGYDRFNTRPYELKRIRINDTDNWFYMWVKLSGYYNLFRAFKNPY